VDDVKEFLRNAKPTYLKARTSVMQPLQVIRPDLPDGPANDIVDFVLGTAIQLFAPTVLVPAVLHRTGLAVVQTLIEAKAFVNVHLPGKSYTPLIWAVMRTNLAVAHTLIEASANLDMRDTSDHECTALHWASQGGKKDFVRLFIEASANLNLQEKRNGLTPLHSAISKQKLEISCMLIEASANLNTRDVHGMTPLHLASRQGDLELARALVKANANVHVQDNKGKTALDLAELKDYTNIVDLIRNNL